MDKTPVHQSFPWGSQHDFWVQCGLCKKRLPLNYMYLLGPEMHELNQVLADLSVPVSLLEMVSVCKLCYYFCQLCLSYKHHQPLTYSNRLFCEKYRKKILHQNKIEVSGSGRKSGFFMLQRSKQRISKPSIIVSERNTRKEKFKNVLNSATNDPLVIVLDDDNGNSSIDSTDYDRTGGCAPTIDSSSLAYPSTSTDLSKFHMQGGFDFRSLYQPGSREGKGDWETCNATLKFTKKTKKDFMSLQKPYGNYSSFMQHLIMLEKYWRSGDLMLSPNASESAKTYISCIGNRIKSLEGPIHTRENLPVPTTSATHFSPALPIVTPCQSVPPLPPLLLVVPSQIPLQMPPPPVTNSANN